MILLLADVPFGPNVNDQLEVSMAKSPSWIAAHWITFSANDFALSSKGGSTWNFIWYIRPSDTLNCWIGDPSVASEPSIQSKGRNIFLQEYWKPEQLHQLVLLNITTKGQALGGGVILEVGAP